MSRAIPKSAAPDRRKIILYATIAIVVLAAIIGVGLASRVPKAASDAPITSTLKVGDTAPEFSIQTNAGPFDLAQVSTPVLVEIFATWCPHCQREATALNAVAQQYAGKLAIVSVSGSNRGIDGNSDETQADVNQFGQQFNVRYPIAFDPDLKIAGQYIQNGYPSLILIDKNKKVSWVTSGETPKAAIDKAVKAVL